LFVVRLSLLVAANSGVGWAYTNGYLTVPSVATQGPAPAQFAGRSTGRPNLLPVGLKIPAIGVSTSVVPLGLNSDKTVEVPSNPADAGWYRLGSMPGARGSAVILGHVDSLKGPAVFYRLRTLTRGAHVNVKRANGTTARFVVRTIKSYANVDFPAGSVYRNKGAPMLTLVTCGGAYDKTNGGYQENVVVTAAYLGHDALS
jgi:sortase (surface protein transpeptidase)